MVEVKVLRNGDQKSQALQQDYEAYVAARDQEHTVPCLRTDYDFIHCIQISLIESTNVIHDNDNPIDYKN